MNININNVDRMAKERGVQYEKKDNDEIKKYGNDVYPWIAHGFCFRIM